MTRAWGRRGGGGFTMIELLIVIVIIGILVAIAVPMYLTQKDKAKDAHAREGGRTIAIACMTFASEGDDTPTAAQVDKATLVAARAITAEDWPPNYFSGEDMKPTTSGARGDYSYRQLGGNDFELTVYLSKGEPFIVP